VAKELRFQSFTSDNEVRSLDVRIKYPPVFIAERIIRKHIQSIVIIKQYPDLPASPTSIRRTKNCRVSPWNSTAIRLSRLLEPSGSQLKSSGRSLVSSRGTVEIMVANNHLVAVRNAPSTLNVEGVFSNLLRWLRVFIVLRCPNWNHSQSAARPEDQSGFPISTSSAF
jgi:hypothetical protein